MDLMPHETLPSMEKFMTFRLFFNKKYQVHVTPTLAEVPRQGAALK